MTVPVHEEATYPNGPPAPGIGCVFTLSYEPGMPDSGLLDPGDTSATIGADIWWDLEVGGTRDIHSENSQHFDSFVHKITDGVVQDGFGISRALLLQGSTMEAYIQNGTIIHGNEAGQLGLDNIDLTGKTIDFIRLRVENLVYERVYEWFEWRMTLTATVTWEFWGNETASQRPGDLNNDGMVDLSDAIMALQVQIGLETTGLISDFSTSGADVNGDGQVGNEEAAHALQVESGVRQE